MRLSMANVTIVDGTAFCIVEPKKMAQECLPRYFRHGRFSSLIRQLNFYSFYRVQEGHLTVYQHSYFRKGRPDLLIHIKRRTAGKAKDPWFDPFALPRKPSHLADIKRATVMNQAKAVPAFLSVMAADTAMSSAESKSSVDDDSMQATYDCLAGLTKSPTAKDVHSPGIIAALDEELEDLTSLRLPHSTTDDTFSTAEFSLALRNMEAIEAKAHATHSPDSEACSPLFWDSERMGHGFLSIDIDDEIFERELLSDLAGASPHEWDSPVSMNDDAFGLCASFM